MEVQKQPDIFQMKDEDYEKELSSLKKEDREEGGVRLNYAKNCCIERLETYFKSSKCKIPWNDKDIELAYKCAQ